MTPCAACLRIFALVHPMPLICVKRATVNLGHALKILIRQDLHEGLNTFGTLVARSGFLSDATIFGFSHARARVLA